MSKHRHLSILLNTSIEVIYAKSRWWKVGTWHSRVLRCHWKGLIAIRGRIYRCSRSAFFLSRNLCHFHFKLWIIVKQKIPTLLSPSYWFFYYYRDFNLILRKKREREREIHPPRSRYKQLKILLLERNWKNYSYYDSFLPYVDSTRTNQTISINEKLMQTLSFRPRKYRLEWWVTGYNA